MKSFLGSRLTRTAALCWKCQVIDLHTSFFKHYILPWKGKRNTEAPPPLSLSLYIYLCVSLCLSNISISLSLSLSHTHTASSDPVPQPPVASDVGAFLCVPVGGDLQTWPCVCCQGLVFSSPHSCICTTAAPLPLEASGAFNYHQVEDLLGFIYS